MEGCDDTSNRRRGHRGPGHLRVASPRTQRSWPPAEDEIVSILRDAASAHENDTGEDGQAELHSAVARLINAIIEGGNSVRRR